MTNRKYNWYTALAIAGATVVSPLILMAVMPPALAVLLGPAAVAIAFFTTAYLDALESKTA